MGGGGKMGKGSQPYGDRRSQTCGGEQTVVYTEVKLTAAHMELT